MRITRSIAIGVTVAATVVTAMGLAAPAYAITETTCADLGGTVEETECLFHISAPRTATGQEQADSPPSLIDLTN